MVIKQKESMLKHTNLILGAIRTTTMNCGANLNGFKTLVNNKLRMRIAPCFGMVKKDFIPKIYQSASADFPACKFDK